jgi:hypothetical protein
MSLKISAYCHSCEVCLETVYISAQNFLAYSFIYLHFLSYKEPITSY